MTLPSAVGTSTIREARVAWKLLNGITCIYKQQSVTLGNTLKIFRTKLCQDLNSMERIPQRSIVDVRRRAEGECDTTTQKDSSLVAEIPDGRGTIQILTRKSYADHPLIVGPGYVPEDIKLFYASLLGKESSGLAILGVNRKGVSDAQLIRHNKWLSTYSVHGELGKLTNTSFHTGKLLEKAKFHKIEKHMIDKILGKVQATHQRMAFDAVGVPMSSDRAFELASKGLVRPQTESAPIVYSTKCVKFKPPHFELEISAINATEEFLWQFVHELGLRLHSGAVCTKVICTKIGPFDLDLALLPKHWDLECVIDNMNQTSKILKGINLTERDPMVGEF